MVRHERDLVAAHVAEVDPECRDRRPGRGQGHRPGHRVRPRRPARRARGHRPRDLRRRAAARRRHPPVAWSRSTSRPQSAVTVITAHLDDPTGYGRDPARRRRRRRGDRRAEGRHRRAARASPRSTPGIYAFDAAVLVDALGQVGTDNAQGEKYLTDVLAIARKAGGRVSAHLIDDLWQTEGVNDRVQLARLGKELNRRTTERWMREGVTIIDPDTTWIDSDVTIGRDATILPGTQLLGATHDRRARHHRPRHHAHRHRGRRRRRGQADRGAPRRHRRRGHRRPVLLPATRAPSSAPKGKIGGFVETKNAKIGAGAKVPHLTYAGDATIGEGANIGAGTIFANYDGVAKHHTTVGRHSFVGSDTRPHRARDHRRRRLRRRRAPRSPVTSSPARSPWPGAASATSTAGSPGPGPARRPPRRQPPRSRTTPNPRATTPPRRARGIPKTPAKGRPRRDRHHQDHREEPDGLLRAGPPRARRGGGEHARHRAGADQRLRLRQRRDLRALRGVGARVRRVRHPEPHDADQRARSWSSSS